MNVILDILFGGGWWVIAFEAIAAVIIIGAALYYFHVDSRHLIWIAGIALAAIFSTSLAQKGWQAKERRDMEEANKAIDRAEQARRKQQEINRDPKKLRAPDRNMRTD